MLVFQKFSNQCCQLYKITNQETETNSKPNMAILLGATYKARLAHHNVTGFRVTLFIRVSRENILVSSAKRHKLELNNKLN